MVAIMCDHPKCGHQQFIQDRVTGDNICTECGLCIHNILLDSYGNMIPENANHMMINVNQPKKNYYKNTISKIKKRIQKIHDVLNFDDNFIEYYHSLIDILAQNKTELRGNGCSKNNICLAIIIKTLDHYNSHINIEDLCKVFSVKITKVQSLKKRLFKNLRDTDDNNMKDDLNKYQKGIIDSSMILEIELGKFPSEDVYYFHDKFYAKSMKIKIALYLYMKKKDELKKITKHFEIQEKQILACVKEIVT